MAELDVALVVPMQPDDMEWLDPVVRRTRSRFLFAGVRALNELEELVGWPLRTAPDMGTETGSGHEPGLRTLGAVTLATALERAGLRWHVVDPARPETLPIWRERIRALAELRPAVVAINTTFILDVEFAGFLCAMVRKELPRAKLIVGGYLYGSDTDGFLGLDADVLCVGEGETRFVDVVRRLLTGADLRDVPGIYFRTASGRLLATPHAEPLAFDVLPLPDWSLTQRMEPPVDPRRADSWYMVETQRGCVFKCGYCTYRTVSAPAELSIERAVDAILNAANTGPGRIWIVDPTTTFPRDRWLSILDRLLERGGSPIPLQVFARVTDLDDEVCAKMAAAGVRDVFVGQESGDQRILDRMRKGTRVSHVRPALEALGRHDIAAHFSFIFGFPGETEESARNTREMLLGLNRGLGKIVAPYASLYVFRVQDFSAISQDAGLRDVRHRFGYDNTSMLPSRAAELMVGTYVAAGLDPEAPVTGFGVLSTAPTSPASFERLKRVDEALAYFARRDLEGTPIPPGMLDRLRRELRSALPERRPRGRLWRFTRRLRVEAIRQLGREWSREAAFGPGPLTRGLVALQVWSASSDPQLTLEALHTARLPRTGARRLETPERVSEQRAIADQLIQLGVATGRKKRRRVQVVTEVG